MRVILKTVFSVFTASLIGFGVLMIVTLWEKKRQCEKVHNVYDCKWTRNPYTPTPTARDRRE